MIYIPTDIKNIILDYVSQIKINEKYKKTLLCLKNIDYSISNTNKSYRNQISSRSFTMRYTNINTIYRYKNNCLLISKYYSNYIEETFWIIHMAFIENNKYIDNRHLVVNKSLEFN